MSNAQFAAVAAPGKPRASTVVPPSVLTGPPDRLVTRRSVVQAPSAAQLQIPDKFRRTSTANQPKLLGMLIESSGGGGGTGRSHRESVVVDSVSKRLSTVNGAPPGGLQFKKPNKAERDSYYSHLKTDLRFKKNSFNSSLGSFGPSSTISSISSFAGFDTMTSVSGMSVSCGSDGGGSGSGSDGSWAMTWCVSKTGRQPGQIKCVRDVLFMSDGNLAVTEEKNARVQIFSAQNGRSLAILGADSENSRTARSFHNPMSFRKMQPTGIGDARQNQLLIVTDLNRILYMDASVNGELGAELVLKDKTHLHGVAATADSQRIILSDVSLT